MKRLFLLTSAMLFAFTVNAQYHPEYASPYDSYYYYNFDYYVSFDKKLIANNHVKEMTEIRVKDAKERKSCIYRYDTEGNILQTMDYSYLFGNLICLRTFTSNGAKKMPDFLSVNGKGKEIRKTTYVYNNDTLITELNKFKKGKFFIKIINRYDSTRLIESYYYKKNMDQPLRKWVYEYYANHSKKTSTLYEKGKIKYVWNYECKDEGELTKKHKDTTEVCKNEETDKDGNRTVTFRKFNEKGKPYKEVYFYNKDKKLIDTKYYNSKDIVYYRYVQNPDNFSSIWYQYNRKGIENNRYENIYNSKNKLVERANYRNQNIQTWRTVYEYNAKDLLVASKNTGRKGKLKHEGNYTYDEHDLLVSEKLYIRNGKPGYENKYTYTFY